MTTIQSERHVRNRILLAVSGLGARLFRVNTGVGWVGKATRNGRYTIIEDARPLQAGLCVGGSDLIGWTPIVITPEMVGTTIACFTALEQKRGPNDHPTDDQDRFLNAVREAGGIAAVVYGTGDAIKAVKGGLHTRKSRTTAESEPA